jgi:hypothetical protein
MSSSVVPGIFLLEMVDKSSPKSILLEMKISLLNILIIRLGFVSFYTIIWILRRWRGNRYANTNGKFC